MAENYLLGLITILLGIIGFFLVKFIKSVEDMQSAVDSLKITIASFTEKFVSNAEKHEIIDKRLESHSERLDKHDKEITELKIKVK